MLTLVTIAFWTAMFAAWGMSGYIYYCGTTQKQVNSNVVKCLVIIGFIAMAIASAGSSITQAAYLSVVKGGRWIP